jgi:hypothetical protein
MRASEQTFALDGVHAGDVANLASRERSTCDQFICNGGNCCRTLTNDLDRA